MAGTRKFSAHKAGGSLLVGAVAASAAAAPLLGIDPWSLVNIETGFALASASSLAGGHLARVPLRVSQGPALGILALLSLAGM